MRKENEEGARDQHPRLVEEASEMDPKESTGPDQAKEIGTAHSADESTSLKENGAVCPES